MVAFYPWFMSVRGFPHESGQRDGRSFAGLPIGDGCLLCGRKCCSLRWAHAAWRMPSPRLDHSNPVDGDRI